MFEYIKGEISELKPTAAVIETGQIGFTLNISLNTYAKIEGQSSAKLFIHEVIREDAFTLYGFAEKEERDIFLLRARAMIRSAKAVSRSTIGRWRR